MSAEDLGPLAAALAKAQSAFPAITRSKTVTVQKKAGGAYTFKYAPLDVVLDAVRKPLASNGLAIAQLIDDTDLVTMLMHESGASLTGRTRLPDVPDVQGLGSAITYLRRYALQAMLGIAAEEDDDGNGASGNTMTVRSDVEHGDDGSLIGTAEVGDKASSDFLLRQTPEGSALGFRLRGAKGGILVETRGPLADQSMAHKYEMIGKTLTVWGAVTDRSFTPPKGRKVTYQVLTAERIRVPDIGDLPVVTEAPSVEMFTAEEQAAIDEALALA